MDVILKFPKPTPDQKRYNEILEEGFSKFPERHENYKLYKKRKLNKIVNYMPIKLDIENCSRCNLRCSMCQIISFKNHKRANDMSFASFKKIVGDQIGIIELKIQGLGEPFLDKNFINMVDYASSKSIWTRTSTNASLLHINENYKRIIDANIGELQISVDGTTQETYEKIRVNASFERMIKNCEMVNEYCHKKNIERTRMWVLLQKQNMEEFKNFPLFAKRLGFNRLAIILDVSGWGDEYWMEKNSSKRISKELNQSDVDVLVEEAKRLNLDIGFWDITSKYSMDNICPWPFERSYISSDSKIVPCCMIGNPDRFNLGDLGEFKDIWNGLSYQKFREAHINGKIPPVCRFCYNIS